MAHMILNQTIGRMAELVDAYALGAYGSHREGSSPSPSIFFGPAEYKEK